MLQLVIAFLVTIFLFSASIEGSSAVETPVAPLRSLTRTKGFSYTPNHVALTRVGSTDQIEPRGARLNNTIIRPLTYHTQYAVEVKFNGIPRYLLLDTGSSDTWMIDKDAQCLDKNLKPVPKSTCHFGPPYTGKVNPIKHVNYQQAYGSGEVILGTFGYGEVEVAGIAVKHQQVAIANRAYYLGNSVMSGVLGLAGRSITMEFPGTHPLKNKPGEVMRYSPLFESMYNATAQIKPLFSLALQRGNNGGYLAFGGLPPINFAHNFATTKFVGVPYKNRAPRNRYYPIKPQGYELAGIAHNTSYVGIVHSGTFACRLPKEIAEKVNAAFDPPAKYIPSIGIYTVACNATAPKFGIKIAGKTFNLDPADMFIKSNGVCATSITRGLPASKKTYPDGFYILGGPFLHNVVAVFDVEHKAMHFASHTNY